MTKKKHEKKDLDKEEKKEESTENSVNTTEKVEVEGEDESAIQEIEHDIIKEKMDAEPELLEEKGGVEPKLLEFYSKEDWIKKVKEFEKEIKTKDEKIKELNGWREKYIHLQAEFENAQKRWEKNRKNLRVEYTASTLKSFLPLYDSFKKALDSKPEENDTLTQFFNQFISILKYQGAEPIETKVNDIFDYNIHEALTSLEKDDVPENSIIDIVQDGWKIRKDILRYSKVVISKKPKPPEPEPEPEPVPEPETEEKEISEDEKKKEKEEEETISNDTVENKSENNKKDSSNKTSD